jgi:hypothetical protein
MRGLAVSTISLLALSGCTSKRQAIKIKSLETDMENLQLDLEKTVEEMEKEISEKEDALRKAQDEASDQIRDLTQERDKIAAEYADFKRKADREAAALRAQVPKEASAPGHSDFDPSQETRFTDAMATIVGDATTFCGFIVEADGKRYLYTAGGSLSGNTRLAVTTSTGEKLTKFGDLEVAEGSPVVRLELLEADALPALAIAAAGTTVGSGTKLTCLGLSANSGSVIGEQLMAFGQSNDAIDSDPNLLVGKIGGPVLETATGKLLGIVVNPSVERAELWDDGTAPGTVPQLNVARLNRSLAWKPVPIASFLAEAKSIAEFDRLTKIAQGFGVVTLTLAGLELNATVADPHTAKSIFTEAKDFPPAADALIIQDQLATKKLRLGGNDLKKRVVSLFVSTSGYLKRNAAGFDPAKFSPYHRKMAENSLRWRADAEERLASASQAVSDADLTPPTKEPDPDRRR